MPPAIISTIWRPFGRFFRRAAGVTYVENDLRQLQRDQEVLRQRIDALPATADAAVRPAVLEDRRSDPAPAATFAAIPAPAASPEERRPSRWRRWHVGEERIRILFVMQVPSLWANWHTVYRAFAEDERFTTMVVLSPFRHEHGTLANLDAARDLLLQEGIPFHQWGFFDLESACPHVVFLQSPYDDTRPAHLQTASLVAAGCRVAYIPYGLEIGGGAANLRWQFDLDIHRSAWRIFARSSRHARMFARHCSAGNGHVVVTGHPKLDLQAPRNDNGLAARLSARIGQRRVVLWTPHFSVGSPAAWSTFRLYGDVIMEAVAAREDLFLLVRPHPLFFSAMRTNGFWDAAGEESFRARIEAAGNMALDETADYHDAFSLASMLLADGGSFLLEFLPTGKPVAYLHHPQGPGLNDDRDLVESYYVVRSVEDVLPVLKAGLDQGDPMRERRMAMLPEYLYKVDGRAGERIRDHVHAALLAGDRPATASRELRTELQHAALEFWQAAQASELASPAYYENKEKTLQEWLATARPQGRMLDLGCSDGRFTSIASAYATEIVGLDVSPSLIDKARQRQDYDPRCKVELFVADLDEHVPFGTFDCVFCMGVTCCLPGEAAYLRLMDRLSHLVAKGGYLVLVDTVSLGAQRQHQEPSGYVATYRSEADYLWATRSRGFEDVWERLLAEDAGERLVNRMRVFRRVE